jgi:hypothetical protein
VLQRFYRYRNAFDAVNSGRRTNRPINSVQTGGAIVLKSCNTFVSLILTGTVILLGVQSVHAGLLAYEDFGTSGVLAGSTGAPAATGWNGAWSFDNYTDGATLATGSVSAPSGVGVGRGGHATTDSGAAVGQYHRSLNAPINADVAGTYYLSAVVTGGDINSSTFYNQIFLSDSGASSTVQFGAIYWSNPGGPLVLGGWEAGANGGNRVETSVIYNASHTYFGVLKLVTGATSDSVFMQFYDATAGDIVPSTEPTTWQASTTANVVGLLDRVIWQGGAGAQLDEVRVATTWGSAVGQAVPEPSSLALVVAGLLSLICYAWKKQK